MQHRAALEQLLIACAERAAREPLSLGTVLAELRESSFCFATIILCLPFFQPMSLGPISTVGGLTLAVIGWQMIRGHPAPVLPPRLYAITPGASVWRTLLGVFRGLLRMAGMITRERLTSWVEGKHGEVVVGTLIGIGGILLAVPLPIAPFSNTLPALVMFFAALALLERDGLMLLVSVVWIVATLAYFGVILYVVAMLGAGAAEWLSRYLPNWLLGGA